MASDHDEKIGEMRARVAALEADMRELKADVKILLSILQQAKGGWRVMAALAGLMGAVAGAGAATFLRLKFGA